MQLRCIVAFAVLAVALPAESGELSPVQARQFVAGKYFSYTCFEGTTGAGRINADGSVVGSIRFRGNGPTRYVALPSNTIRINPDSVCASVRGMPFTPCFNVNQTNSNSFRGSVSGFGFAYCDFTRHHPRMQVAQSHMRAPARARIIRPSVVVKHQEPAPARNQEMVAKQEEPQLRTRTFTAD